MFYTPSPRFLASRPAGAPPGCVAGSLLTTFPVNVDQANNPYDSQDSADSDDYPRPQWSSGSFGWCFRGCRCSFGLEAERSAPIAWRWLDAHHSPEVVGAVIQRAIVLLGGGGYFCLSQDIGQCRILSQDELVLRGVLER